MLLDFLEKVQAIVDITKNSLYSCLVCGRILKSWVVDFLIQNIIAIQQPQSFIHQLGQIIELNFYY